MRKQKYFKRAAAIGTAVVLACSMTACGTKTNDKENTTDESSDKSEEKLVETMSKVTGIGNSDKEATDKEETVYVIADNKGTPTEVVVSEWLKNNSGGDTVEDVTNLTDVKNVKGDEKFTVSGSKIMWDAKGADIYYQGKSKEEVPVGVKVTYYLDGKETSPEQLLGASGNVKIRYDYINKSTTKAGKKEIYTPFVMATGMILPTDSFKNVNVSNGQVISEGNNAFVIGFGMPGLEENLALDDFEDLDLDADIPDYFEMSADVVDFSLGMTVTLCSNSLIDLGKIADEINTKDLEDQMDELSDGANQLVDGTGKLSDGTATLKDGTGKLTSGVNELSDGIKTYTDGVSSVNNGAVQLNDGATQLDDGATQLVDGLSSAKDGSAKLKDGLSSAKDGASTLTDKLGDAKDGSTKIKDGLEQLNNSAPALIGGIVSAQNGLGLIINGYEGNQGLVAGAQAVADGLAQLNEQVKGIVLPDMSSQSSELTAEQKAVVEQTIKGYFETEEGNAVLTQSTTGFVTNVEGLLAQNGVTLDAQTKGALEAVMSGVFKQAFINTYIAAYQSGMEKGMGEVLAEVTNQLSGFAPMISALQGATQQLADGSAAVSNGVKSEYDGAKQLEAGLAQLYEGAQALPNGVDQLYAGSTSLTDGLSQLQDGANTLFDGTKQLHSGSEELDAGVNKLSEGAKTLKEGTTKLKSGTLELKNGSTTLDKASAKIISGIDELRSGAKQLDDGATELKSGSLELKDGMVKLNDEGISKITSLVKDDVNDVVDRFKAVSDANDEYTLYGGIADGKKGAEKFIIKVDGIE